MGGVELVGLGWGGCVGGPGAVREGGGRGVWGEKGVKGGDRREWEQASGRRER